LDLPDHSKLLPFVLADLKHLPRPQRQARGCRTKTEEDVAPPGRPRYFEREEIRHPTENVAVAVFVCPRKEHVTVAVPPEPDVSSCQLQLTVPELPTDRDDPSKDAGERPVE